MPLIAPTRTFLLSLLPAILWLAGSRACAKEPTIRPGFGIDASLLGGRVFKHEKKFTLPIPAFTTGADVNFVWHTYGRKEWEQRRHYPRIGLALAAINYGIDSVYGTMAGVYPNITLPLVSGNRLEWNLRLGTGISYVTRRFSRTDGANTVNVAVGAHVNDLIMLKTDLYWLVNRHCSIHAGAFVNHISNGSVRKPNLGVNVAGISAGVAYFPNTSRPAIIHRELAPIPARWLLQLRGGMSVVSANTPGGPMYPVYVSTASVSRRWRGVNKAFAGIDYSYHPGLLAQLRDNGQEPHGQQQPRKAAVLAGNEFLMGRVGIGLQAGAYLLKGYLQKEDVYQKVSLNYYAVQRERGPVKEVFAYISLKAHLNVAEMGELGIGVGL